jgi:hypothetical protein
MISIEVLRWFFVTRLETLQIQGVEMSESNVRPFEAFLTINASIKKKINEFMSDFFL